MESASESLSGDVELSEGEFAAYGGNAEEQDTSDSGSRGHGAETLNPGQLEECREREVRLVCLVRCDLGAAQVRELLIGARWDVRRLLRAGSDAELDGGAGAGTPEADSCPVCLMSLSGEAEPGEEPPVFFTGCSNGARHGAHAQCMAVYVRSCIKDAATQRGARPGVVAVELRADTPRRMKENPELGLLEWGATGAIQDQAGCSNPWVRWDAPGAGMVYMPVADERGATMLYLHSNKGAGL